MSSLTKMGTPFMPNWVSNNVNAVGPIEDVRVLVAKVGSPILTHPDSGPAGDDDPVFSFMNIVSPWHAGITEDEYFSVADSNAPANNWYNWNWENWDTKWDACEVSHEFYDRGNEAVAFYRFDTAWSPPIKVIAELSRQFPTLTLTLEFLEEQGWGGEFEFVGGEGVVLRQWDIPTTHAERVNVFSYCWCADEHKEDWPYDDCTGEL